MIVIRVAILVLCVISTLQPINCAKILGIIPAPAPSHYILGNALLKGLAEKGHDVTMISSFEDKIPPKNGSYRNIILTGFIEQQEKNRETVNLFDMGDKSPFTLLPFIMNFMIEATEKTLSHPNVQDLINSNEHFDVVIMEQFNNDAHKGFATHFKAPLILLSTVGANAWVNTLVGNPEPSSYIPNILLSFSSHMTFKERIVNSVYNLFSQVIHHMYLYPKQGQIYEKYFSNGPAFSSVLYNASLVLLNSHPSINQPVPYVPSMIDIGGFHVRPPKKLPEDLQKFLDNAKEGVVYFSLGSNARSADLPEEKRDALLNTFGKLKEKVLWKWEVDVLPGQPSNVKLGKWLPQQDILAHPNVKLFITHGGLLSTIETIYHGVPVLAIPISADQNLNARAIVNQEFGLMLPYKELTEQDLNEKLNELLSNQKYAKVAKTRSKIFHDRLINPLDTATYWVEYVIRHGGAPHLRVASLDLAWYQYFLLDVIALISISTLVTGYLVYVVFKKIVLLCFSKNNQKLKRN